MSVSFYDKKATARKFSSAANVNKPLCKFDDDEKSFVRQTVQQFGGSILETEDGMIDAFFSSKEKAYRIPSITLRKQPNDNGLVFYHIIVNNQDIESVSFGFIKGSLQRFIRSIVPQTNNLQLAFDKS